MKQRIAFFDFDGTITTRDSFFELIKFQKGVGYFYWGLLVNSPVLIAYKLGLISNQAAKQGILRFFFKDISVIEFHDHCNRFGSTMLPALIRPKALKEIKALIQMGTKVVIVSASAGDWIKNWSDANGIQLVATLLEEKKGRITGNIRGKNCYGAEKVNRIKSAYDLSLYEEIYCYGDTKGDFPMLHIGTHTFYKPFT